VDSSNASACPTPPDDGELPDARSVLEDGDLIVSYDRELVTGIDRLQQILDGRRIDLATEVVFLRRTQRMTAEIRAIERSAGLSGKPVRQSGS
jgi:S1-C subfamily serine protease